MKETYRTFFGLEREPFRADPGLNDILETDEIKGVKDRFDYAVRLGAIALVTGEIGSGKSTALRYAAARLHPSEYKVLCVTAVSGSILETYRMILAEMGIETASPSRSTLEGSGGLFRKANHLARGALMAAARGKSATVAADHVRLAATEIF